MSDQNPTAAQPLPATAPQPHTGPFATPDGSGTSSGRVVKVFAFIAAVALAGYGVVSDHDASVYVGMFLGVATIAEGIQKITGK